MGGTGLLVLRHNRAGNSHLVQQDVEADSQRYRQADGQQQESPRVMDVVVQKPLHPLMEQVVAQRSGDVPNVHQEKSSAQKHRSPASPTCRLLSICHGKRTTRRLRQDRPERPGQNVSANTFSGGIIYTCRTFPSTRKRHVSAARLRKSGFTSYSMQTRGGATPNGPLPPGGT